jgi:YgiT-type zinc finger domain-containing protein
MKLEKKAVTRAKVCPECGAAMKSGRTTLHFERDGFYADAENVSALLCGRCGTRSIPGPTAAKISETVSRLFKSGKDLNSTGISFHRIAS